MHPINTVLITGARAPAALELCRQFAHAGWRVIAADSLSFPLTRFSNTLAAYHRLPSPRWEFAAFRHALLALINRERVSLIVPTCEEVFHLARLAPDLPAHVKLFAASAQLLGDLHHKARLLELACDCGVEIPASITVRSTLQLDTFMASMSGIVMKPVYSRFANRTLISPTPAQAHRAMADPTSEWIAQQFITGEELCSYSVAHAGGIAAHVCYRPVLRAGRGAGVYFQPAHAPEVRLFVETFARCHGITGQIAFDFIRTPEGRLFVLECNPRATSGAHLFGPGELAEAIASAKRTEPNGTPAMIGMACVSFALGQLLRQPRRWKFLRPARDAIWASGDRAPSFAQALSLAELSTIALRQRISLQAASTHNIEWNGPHCS